MKKCCICFYKILEFKNNSLSIIIPKGNKSRPTPMINGRLMAWFSYLIPSHTQPLVPGQRASTLSVYTMHSEM